MAERLRFFVTFVTALVSSLDFSPTAGRHND